MAGRLSKGLRAVTFVAMAIVVVAGGCHHPRPTPADATAASYEELHALIGRQVTIRGTFSLWGKFGAFVSFGHQQVIYLVPKGSFTWGEQYSEMEGKLVAATGTLCFYLSPNVKPTGRAVARAPDYFYFEAETAQLRLISQ